MGIGYCYLVGWKPYFIKKPIDHHPKYETVSFEQTLLMKNVKLTLVQPTEAQNNRGSQIVHAFVSFSNSFAPVKASHPLGAITFYCFRLFVHCLANPLIKRLYIYGTYRLLNELMAGAMIG